MDSISTKYHADQRAAAYFAWSEACRACTDRGVSVAVIETRRGVGLTGVTPKPAVIHDLCVPPSNAFKVAFEDSTSRSLTGLGGWRIVRLRSLCILVKHRIERNFTRYHRNELCM